MKKFVAIAIACALLAGCAKSKVIDGKEYQPYGLVTSDRESKNVQYEINFGSVVCAVIFFETFIVPIYVAGWNLYEPIKRREDSDVKVHA